MHVQHSILSQNENGLLACTLLTFGFDSKLYDSYIYDNQDGGRVSHNILNQHIFSTNTGNRVYELYYSIAHHFGCILLILAWLMLCFIMCFVSLTGCMPVQWYPEAVFFFFPTDAALWKSKLLSEKEV